MSTNALGYGAPDYAVAAADHASFRRAATLLGVTQPTLSKRIRELEARLGVSLFQRSTAGTTLMPIGEEFVASARRILAEVDTIKARAGAARFGHFGRLGIGFYTSISSGLLRNAILAFNRQHPNVDICFVERSRSALFSFLSRGTIDIAIVLGERIISDYTQLTLWGERVLVALSNEHRLAARDFVYWTDLKPDCFLLSQRDPGPELADLVRSKLTSPGDRPTIKLLNANRKAIFSIVSGNRGVTLVCESSLGQVIQGTVYREVRDGNGPTRVGYIAYWRRDNINSALGRLLTLLRAQTVPPELEPTPEEDAHLLTRPRRSV